MGNYYLGYTILFETLIYTGIIKESFPNIILYRKKLKYCNYYNENNKYLLIIIFQYFIIDKDLYIICLKLKYNLNRIYTISLILQVFFRNFYIF